MKKVTQHHTPPHRDPMVLSSLTVLGLLIATAVIIAGLGHVNTAIATGGDLTPGAILAATGATIAVPLCFALRAVLKAMERAEQRQRRRRHHPRRRAQA